MSEVANGSGPLLRLEGINTYYGQMHILHDANLQVGKGELVCLLGGNASGKSTTLKTVLGIVCVRAPARSPSTASRSQPLDELPHRPGNGDRPREPASLRPDDGPREPADGRVPALAAR